MNEFQAIIIFLSFIIFIFMMILIPEVLNRTKKKLDLEIEKLEFEKKQRWKS